MFTDLSAVKAQLGIPETDTSKDVPLNILIDGINADLLAIFSLDSTSVTAYVEKHDVVDFGCSELRLKRYPVVAVTEVKDNETVIDAADYSFNERGLIVLDGGRTFTPGRRKVQVSFTAGWASAADYADLSYAALVTAVMAWNQDRSAGLESEQIGRYRYKLAGVSGAGSGPGSAFVYPPTASRILARYHRVFPVTTTRD